MLARSSARTWTELLRPVAEVMAARTLLRGVRRPYRRAYGRRCALRQRNAQRARGGNDAVGVLRRYRHRAAVRQHLRAYGRRACKSVDDGGNVGTRQVHADGARATQGLAACARKYGNAQHKALVRPWPCVSEPMSSEKSPPDVARSTLPLQLMPLRAGRGAQLHGYAVLGIFPASWPVGSGTRRPARR